ncbi:helix-turn-helix domain-containing protein [Streptomyces sp. CC224B]|uniref:MarR family transcriptional regulator n=1 Tax=Streptomyces sp. CC224B TaxID=3044571 RepID=UPI0024A8D11F|nr:helix-turn-helix domain-containing protein [Streptomyces sp. CC224B]
MQTETAAAPAELTNAQRKALAALADNPGAKVAEIALAAGIGASTAGKALTALEAHNLAHRERWGKVGGRQAADRWYPRPAATEPQEPASEGAEAAPHTAAPAAQAALAQTPAAEPDPAAAGADEDPALAEAPQADEAPASPRLARGGLRQMVYEHLEAHPDDEVTAPRLAKALGRSAGAVANALAKLTQQGQADLVGESPRRYRLANQA